MKKPTKFILTREQIEKDLRSHLKRVISNRIFMCLFALLLSLLASLGLFFIISERIPIPFLIFVIIAYLTLPLCLSSLIYHLAERKKLLQGKYMINLRPLLDKKTYGGSPEQRFLYFEGFRRKEVEYPQYEHATTEDTYYIVHCENSRCIRLVYPTKAYELDEGMKKYGVLFSANSKDNF